MIDIASAQDMLRPSVEELVRVKDVDVQMREFLANLRVAVEAGQKGKKKKAKKKAKKKKEKKGKKKKDPTEGRSMERCHPHTSHLTPYIPYTPPLPPFTIFIPIPASTASWWSQASSSPYQQRAYLISRARSRTQTLRQRGVRAMRRSHLLTPPWLQCGSC